MWLQKSVQYLISIYDFDRKTENLPVAVLMDLLDAINHELLIAKLHAYGFSKDSLEMILNYLSNRHQRVKINTAFSSWIELIQGVPQGSVLDQILFNICLNDLFFMLNDTDIC